MKKVYQTEVGDGSGGIRGNCMQAACASLFDLNIDGVPNFIELDKGMGEAYSAMFDFFESKGFDPTIYGTHDTPIEDYKQKMNIDGGVNGFFYACINSPTFKGSTHAVIVDSYLNIVHDPNPNEKCLGLIGGVNYIILMSPY